MRLLPADFNNDLVAFEWSLRREAFDSLQLSIITLILIGKLLSELGGTA